MSEPIHYGLPVDFEAQFHSRTILFTKHALRWRRTPSDANILSKLKRAHIAVACNKDLLETPNGQHMALMSTNLLSRFCQNIDVSIPGKIQSKIDIPLPTKTGFFLHDLLKLLQAINPVGRIRPKLEPRRVYDAAIVIGEESVKAKRTISINSDGWAAYLYPNSKDLAKISGNQNPLGAQLSACFGTVEAFKAIFSTTSNCNPLDVSPSKPLTFSLFNYTLNTSLWQNPPLPESVPLGAVHLIGAGAIGSALAYSLRSISRVSGALTVIDPEIIETSNLNRYLPAIAKDAFERKPKVESVKDLLSESLLQVTVFHNTYQNYVSKRRSLNLDLVVAAVDNDETRWAIQNNFPRLILNGATGVSSVSISRHDEFLEKACLGCLYPRGKEQIAPMPCPTISFVSGISGVLLAAEMIKERVEKFRKFVLNNELYLDCLKLPQTLMIRQTQKSELCGCRCQDQQTIKSYLSARKSSHTITVRITR